jgi:hypothetical protein
VDLNRLRRLAADIDVEQREAMRAFHERSQHAAGAPDASRASRRRFLQGLGLGGAALTVGAAAIVVPAVAAGAQTSTTTTGGPGSTTSTSAGGTGSTTTVGATPSTTTTTTLPFDATDEDLTVLNYAQSVELAMVDVYVAAAPKLVGSDILPIALAFAAHHNQHGQAYGGLAGKAALGVANASILAAYEPRMTSASGEQDVLKVLFDLENAAASTYVTVLNQLRATNPATTVASVLPIESRHAAVIGQALNLPLEQQSPTFETTSNAFTADQYPIAAR